MKKQLFILCLTVFFILAMTILSYARYFQSYGISFKYPKPFEVVGQKTNKKTSKVAILYRKKFSSVRVSIFNFKLNDKLEDMALFSSDIPSYKQKFKERGYKNVKFSQKMLIKLPFKLVKTTGKLVKVQYEIDKVKFVTNIYLFNYKNSGYIIDMTKPLVVKADFNFFFDSFMIH